ncbi:flavodoxin-like protein [Ramicandelaber brevisporus]|nr:flavodoxin-like protein [Ramicandelaber brevisporus]
MPSIDSIPTTKIAIVIHSIYHHVHKLALSVKEGIESVPGVEARLYRVQEILPKELLAKMHAAPELSDIPLATPSALIEADGIIFGVPSRFGSASTQIRAFLDSLYVPMTQGALAGKFGGIFFSTSQQAGGQESVALTFVPFFASHGINYVPLGYRHKSLTQIDELAGGSPYGSGTITGLNVPLEVRPTALELDGAKTHGQIFADVVQTAVAGKAIKAVFAQKANY